jgi:hypothetical protein
MAIYHLHAKMVQRNKGQSAAAAALGVSMTTYLIISEGSRLFPPRNLVPVP